MPTPHGGSGLPSVLLAVLVAAAIAAALWTQRHRLAQLAHPVSPDPTTDVTEDTDDTDGDTADGTAAEDGQGAIPFDGFDPDQIYGPPLDDAPT